MTAKPPTLTPGDRVLVVGQPEPARNGVHVLGFIESDEPPEVDEHGNPLDVRAMRAWMAGQLEALHKRTVELREGVERGDPLAILEATRFAAMMKPHAAELAAAVAAGMAKRVKA